MSEPVMMPAAESLPTTAIRTVDRRRRGAPVVVPNGETAAADDAVAEATSRWLTFSLAGVRYAVEVARVQEILRPRPLTPVPGGAHWLAGIMNLRGAIVPVLSLHRLLDQPAAEQTDDSRVLVTDVTGEAVGLQVDAVGGVWHAADRLFEPAPAVGDARATLPVGGVFQRTDGVVLVLDVAAVIGRCAGQAPLPSH